MARDEETDMEAQATVYNEPESTLEDRKATYCRIFCAASTTIILLCILLPLSLSGVEYYNYGFAMRRSTGAVSTDRVYEAGLYGMGPDFKFKVFNRGAHIVQWKDISMWSNSNSSEAVGLEFKVLLLFTHYALNNPSQVFNITDEMLLISPPTLKRSTCHSRTD